MPPRKNRSKGSPPSRKTKRLAVQLEPPSQAPSQGASGPQKSSKSAGRQNRLQTIENTLPPRPKRHTRRSQGSPLRERRDDINKVLSKGKREPEKSLLVVKSPPQGESSSEEAALDDNLEGRRDQWEPDRAKSRDSQGGESPSAHSSTDSETVSWLRNSPNADETFLLRSGYTVPLSNEALAAISVVLSKEAAIRMGGLNSTDPEFGKSLEEDRNVLRKETRRNDPELGHLDTYDFTGETDEPSIANYLDGLWSADLSFCKGQQEAIFQRTIMMSMVNRYKLIFSNSKTSDDLSQSALMFSVESLWTCEPMPTARVSRITKADRHIPHPKTFTNAPRPDLCVSFRRSLIIDSALWKRLPAKTQRLVCYEGVNEEEIDRAFGFFFVEAKRSRIDPDDSVARNQSLNDASQALHNLYEFFNEAGQAQVFFERVRVFSATASEKGVILRIHWAVELPEDSEFFPERIVEDYPLQFEHQTCRSFRGEDFNRLKVIEAFEKIMRGYGETQLMKLLQGAVDSVREKVKDAWKVKDEIPFESRFNDYRHGQTGKPGSRAGSKQQTPAVEGSQPRSSTPVPPQNQPRPLQVRQSSDVTEVIDGAGAGAGARSSLSQDISALQTNDVGSQRSKSSHSRRRSYPHTEGGKNAGKRPRNE
ncbi:MAG: hypothetical protein Q9160_009306 [Pyrenula sp. 1 TL-2023]